MWCGNKTVFTSLSKKLGWTSLWESNLTKEVEAGADFLQKLSWIHSKIDFIHFWTGGCMNNPAHRSQMETQRQPLQEETSYTLLLTPSMPSRLGIQDTFLIPSDFLFGVNSATTIGGQVDSLRVFPKTNSMVFTLVHHNERRGTWSEPEALACGKTDLLCLDLFCPNYKDCL